MAGLLAEHITRFPIGPNDLLFYSPFCDYRAARRVFSRACRLARLRSVTLHDLRHTFAVHAAQAGVPNQQLHVLWSPATAQTNVALTEGLLESVRKAMPPQPWPKAIH